MSKSDKSLLTDFQREQWVVGNVSTMTRSTDHIHVGRL